MEDWELGLIIGCSVLSVILIALAIRYLCKSRGSDGESKPLLQGDQKTTSTANALRFDSHIPADPPAPQTAESGFLDAAAMKRIAAWVDEVEKQRSVGEGLVPLIPGQPETVQLLGDTPDLVGGNITTPRTPNSLSPRISGVCDDKDSTSNVVLGYSPKQNSKVN